MTASRLALGQMALDLRAKIAGGVRPTDDEWADLLDAIADLTTGQSRAELDALADVVRRSRTFVRERPLDPDSMGTL